MNKCKIPEGSMFGFDAAQKVFKRDKKDNGK